MVKRLTDALVLGIEVDLFSVWLLRAQIADSQRGPTYGRVKIQHVVNVGGRGEVHFTLSDGRYKFMAIDDLGGIRMSLDLATPVATQALRSAA